MMEYTNASYKCTNVIKPGMSDALSNQYSVVKIRFLTMINNYKKSDSAYSITFSEVLLNIFVMQILNQHSILATLTTDKQTDRQTTIEI